MKEIIMIIMTVIMMICEVNSIKCKETLSWTRNGPVTNA